MLDQGTTLYLWIDALCINQDDLSERENQVTMMGAIYAQARQVIAFLGQADNKSINAMDLMLLVSNCISGNQSLHESATASGMVRLLSEIGPGARDSTCIQGLLSRRWFYRSWVVQEVALGNDPVLICGQHALSWYALWQFLDFNILSFRFPAMFKHDPFALDAFTTTQFSLPNAAMKVAAHLGQRDRYWSQMPFLAFLSASCISFDCSDSRDRIYAFLGLASAKKYRDALRPDYRIKVEELYIKVARLMLTQGGNIQFLHVAGIGHRRSLSLPSWVPDWTSIPRQKAFYANLSGPLAKDSDSEGFGLRFDFDRGSPHVLKLYGRIIDTVSLMVRESLPLWVPSLTHIYCS
ncbi:hypothetical protein Daus18300_007189 [Diaporthe australafricana]|uniref:Heterokaryon incompatibility domain-containing protein n=1 Tax=Diaporthe australafricana TaxID=127596 RepID=A0ABR3WNQ4_9PEZI